MTFWNTSSPTTKVMFVLQQFFRLRSSAIRSLRVYIQQEDAILKILTSRGKGVRDLTLPTVTCRIWNALPQLCPELAEICIRSSPVALKSGEQPLPLMSLHTLEIASSANPWVTHVVPNLRSLTLPASVKQYYAIVPLMPQLEQLHITFDDVPQEQYDLLAAGLSTAAHLRTIDFVERMPEGKKRKHDRMLTALRAVLPQLTSVSLVTDLVHNSDLLTYLNPQRDQLTRCILNLSLAEMLELNLSPSTAVHDLWLTVGLEMLQAASAFQHIEFLTLNLYGPMPPFPAVPFPKTTTLLLYGTEGAPFDSMLHKLTLFPNLTSLTWDYRDEATVITSQELNDVMSRCPASLTRLDMTLLNLPAVEPRLSSSVSLLHVLPNVKQLCISVETDPTPSDDLSYFLVLLPNITSFACRQKFTLAQLLPLAPQLTSLSISLQTVQAGLSVLRQFTRLESLDICTHTICVVRFDSLFEELCCLMQLQSLTLEAVLIQATPLRRLLTACSRLRSLKFLTPCTISTGCCAVLGEMGSLLRKIVLPSGEDFDCYLSMAKQFRGCCLDSLAITYVIKSAAREERKEFWAKLASKHAEIVRECEPVRLSVNPVSASAQKVGPTIDSARLAVL